MKKSIIVCFILFSIVFSVAAGEIRVRTGNMSPHEQLAARELKYYGKKLDPSGKKFFLATEHEGSLAGRQGYRYRLWCNSA